MGSLTQLQKSIVIGTILGDDHLRKAKGRNDALLEINHSAKAKDYVDWKYSILKNISKSPPKIRENNRLRIAYCFTTCQHKELTKFYKMFYVGKKKRIPNIKLDPIMLAVWFMDDGSRCRDRDVYLNTQQFGYSDQMKLVKMLYKIGLRAKTNKDKVYYRLRFLKADILKLNKLIARYIVPSMRYKLSYDPVETWL